VREVVLDVVEPASEGLPGESLGQQLRRALALAAVAETVAYQAQIRDMEHEIAELVHEVRTAVLIERNVLDIGQANPGFAQAIGNGLGRKSSPVLHAPEAFFFSGGNEDTISDKGRRRISVECIQAKNIHKDRTSITVVPRPLQAEP
jgi:hypothetical protein